MTCSPGRRVLAAVATIMVLLVLAPAAHASLRLEPVPGPDGAGLPFRSPAGVGPVFAGAPPGDTHRLFVGTRDGYIYVIVDGELRPAPYADLHALTTVDNQNGLMSFAFDADWAENGRMYVMYSDTNATGPPAEQPKFRDVKVDVIARSASAPDRVDPATRVNVITIPSIYQAGCTIANAHHGGQVQVGEDGRLWIAVGDGGDGCGAHFSAPLLTTLRGKILRVAPAAGGGYTIPPDNPLAGQGGGVRQEIWANGLRNPWRFAFDRRRDEVVIGDVGNTEWEEIDVVPSSLAPGAPPPFFGWGCFEHTGTIFSPCPVSQAVAPATLAFSHAGASCASLTGGVVVDDPSLGADYQGRYLYGYFCAPDRGSDGGSSRLLSVDLHAATPTPRSEGVAITSPGGALGLGLVSFGEDGCGHPYAMNLFTGWIFRIEGETPGPCGQHRPPETTIDAAPSGRVAAGDARVVFASSVRGSSFTCALDGGAAAPCASPATFPGLPDGDHTVEIAARDEAGNVDPTPARAAWRTDARPPDVRVVAAPSGTTQARDARIEFAVDDGEARCGVDAVPVAPCTSPLVLTGLAPGPHKVTVDAVDALGRRAAAPPTVTWEIVDPPVTGQSISLARVRLLGSRRVRASRGGRVTLRLEGFPVPTTVIARVRRGSRTAGSAKPVTGRPGRAAALAVALNRTTRAALRRHRAVKLTVTVQLTATGAPARQIVVPLVVRQSSSTARR